MSIRTRFAPSPTGRLHLGHALAALVAHDMARKHPGGQFLLRFEDIDTPRVREPFYQEIMTDLEWLGLKWNEEPLRQSHRTHAYQAALDRLRDDGFVYPCFCTRREIQQEWTTMAGAPHGPDGPLYSGTCRLLSQSEQQEKITAGIAHSWRLDSHKAAQATGPLTFHDLRFGTITTDPASSGDVILSRKDIGTSYHLAVVVDDAYQQITHVTRGEDLLAATHVHRTLQALLDLPTPIYLHHPLVLDDQGKRLAKRHDALSLATLRDAGTPPGDIIRKCREFMTATAGL